MVSRTGIGIGIGIPFKNKVSGGGLAPLPPNLKDSLVGVWIADQNNNDSATRNIIKNKVGDGGDFEILNAAYKLNSGYGKYEVDFNSWVKTTGVSTVDSKITLDSTHTSQWICYAITGTVVPTFKVIITGIPAGGSLRMFSGTLNQVIYNGENTIQGFTADEATGFFIYSGTELDWSNLVIEQIPSFQGALVTDGVDDVIVSQNTVQKMLGGSNEITVVSMIHQIESYNSNISYTNYIRNDNGWIRNNVTNIGKTGVYGYSYKNNATNINNILGDKNDYSTEGNLLGIDSVFSVAGRSDTVYSSKIAWYWTFIANRVLTTDEINQVIAYYNLDKYVKPDVYYDVKKQGLSNETPDADWYLKDFSSNGHDVQLYNFAKKLGSGVGKYVEDYILWSKSTINTVTTSKLFNKASFTGTAKNGWLMYKNSLVNTIAASKVRITGIKGFTVIYAYFKNISDTFDSKIKLSSDGEYNLPTSVIGDGRGVGFQINSLDTVDINIVIEQIPDYEGALVFDGVDDYGKVDNLPIYKDYTVVADREIVDGLITNADGGIATRSNHYGSGAFGFDYKNQAFSFGGNTNREINVSRFISYQSKYVNNDIKLTTGNKTDNNPLYIARLGVENRYSKLALWSFLLFPYTLSEFLLERQLKRYKLGSIYPSNSIVFRYYITSNLPYNVIEIRINNELVYYWINQNVIVDESGKYFPKGSTMNIKVKHDSTLKIPSKIKYNGKEYEASYYANGMYQVNVTLDKTPQKIEIQIDEYIRYEDIVQPYPFIIPIIDTDGKEYTYGDKIKVGTEIRGGINGNNLLPELYKLNGYFNFNGAYFSASNKHVIGKTNVFELTNAPTYLKANEPNCIADPQRLHIPNSSYKILGYIPDISGHGNHLKINNSAYAGMSGANGYMADFTNWQHTGVEGKATDSKFEAIGIASTRWILYKGEGYNFPTTTYIVTGIPKDVSLTYNNDTTALQIENGVPFTIASYSASSSTGFVLSKGVGADLTGLIIEQIGEYEGSFCLDGVDDFITIPTLSHGAKQVLMKVNYRLRNNSCTIYDQRNSSQWDPTFCIYSNNMIIAYSTGNSGKTYIDGILNTSIEGKQLANITHNITIANEDVTDANSVSPKIGTLLANGANFAQMALFAFMSFPEISPEEEIKELNDIVGVEGNV